MGSLLARAMFKEEKEQEEPAELKEVKEEKEQEEPAERKEIRKKRNKKSPPSERR